MIDKPCKFLLPCTNPEGTRANIHFSICIYGSTLESHNFPEECQDCSRYVADDDANELKTYVWTQAATRRQGNN